MNKKLKEFILHASLIKGIGPKTIQILTKEYTDQETNFYNLSLDELIQKGLLKQKAELLYNELKNHTIINEECLLINKNNIHYITPYEIEYSSQLKNQETYPPVIYLQQKNINFNINNHNTLAIVSSRETNSYGKRVIYKLLEEIAGHDIIIVSGGAIGGDTYIHEAALSNHLKTIAIIGAGLNNWYPKNNIILFNKIIENNGIIMSHFPVNTTANKSTFPIRNSIIAGITQATLVIQAGIKSGTLITANNALEYGKDVGSVPGYIDDIIMIESNNLIKNGACCITSGDDILNMLNIKKNHIKNKKNTLYNDCNIQQKKILEMCREPKTIEEISINLNININDIYNELFILLEKKHIKQDILGNWKTIYF